AARAPDPLDRVEALTRAYVRFAIAHRAHYGVMFAALHASPEPDVGDGSGAVHAASAAAIDAASAGRSTGHSAGPVADLAAAAFAAFDHLVGAVTAVDPHRDAAEIRRRALLVWAQAHGTVGIADAARGLDRQHDPEALAADAGRAARALVGSELLATPPHSAAPDAL
ncbi:MAG: WHG domain-containing protein, partial [Dermatophilaceae bacterium]